MSGYTQEDDAADRAYWSNPAHGGAGNERDNRPSDESSTIPEAGDGSESFVI